MNHRFYVYLPIMKGNIVVWLFTKLLTYWYINLVLNIESLKKDKK